MRVRKVKGQGATEYLLMLAAVLVIVAVAIYYVTRTAGAPTITANLAWGTSDNSVKLNVVSASATIPAADWQYKIWKTGDSQPTSWTAGAGDIASGNQISLKTSATPGFYYVVLYHIPTGNTYPTISQQVGP
jgi:hypothetical protein